MKNKNDRTGMVNKGMGMMAAVVQNKRMNGIKEHIPHLFYQFVNCIQHIVIV